MDSGFGPFALTRMCYETGGIYFSVHPSRNVHREVSRDETPTLTAHLKYFFDPEIMRRYRPDYVSAEEYLRRAEGNRARASLLLASKKSWGQTLAEPVLRFVRHSDVLASLVRAQAYHARLAQAKAGMPFQDGNNNTWVLVPSDDLTAAPGLAETAAKAKEYLQGVINYHPGTPPPKREPPRL
jgi:hypothetical protein